MFKILSCHRNEFWDWCMEKHIACEYMGTEFNSRFERIRDPEYDTWYIGNEQDRMMAILRWA